MDHTLLPLLAAAQTATATAAPDIGTIIQQGGQIFTDWKTHGVLAAVITLVTMLVNLTRIPVIDAWINTPSANGKDKKWVRPLLAMVLAGLGGAAASAQAHAPVLNCIVAGLFAGLASMGMHELYSWLTGNGRTEAPPQPAKP